MDLRAPGGGFAICARQAAAIRRRVKLSTNKRKKHAPDKAQLQHRPLLPEGQSATAKKFYWGAFLR